MATTVENGNTYITYESTAGSETVFAIPFPFLLKGHIKVSVNDVVQVQDTAYTVNVGANTITLTTPTTALDNVKIWRNTEWLTRLVDFASGAQVTESDLDTSALQLLYIIQEVIEDNIAGTVTIDIGPGGGGGGGTGIGGVNVIDYTMPSDTTTIPLGTTGLNKNSLTLYRNGIYVPPSDWEINVDGDTITTDYNFLTGDKVNVLYLFGSIVTTINTSVVTTASILDGAITNSKLAADAVTTDKILDGEILYKDCDTTFDGNWASLADGDEGVAGMLTNLNTRVETLTAAAGLKVAMQSYTLTPSATSLTKAYAFTPDYVVVHIYRTKDTYGSTAFDEYPQGSWIAIPGTQTHTYRVHVGAGGSSASDTQDFVLTLSGANLTIAASGAFASGSAEYVFKAVAYKEA